MKILIYSANFAPEPTGVGKYSGEMATWLAEHGHEVRVVCTVPYYPAWKVFDGYSWPPYQSTVWNKVKLWRCPLWVPKKPSGLKRVIHLLSFAVTSVPVMLRQMFWKPDVVMTVAPAFVCAPMGLLASRLTDAKSWLHVQDFEVDVAFQMGLLKGKLLEKVVVRLEQLILHRFDVVSTISSRMINRLHQKKIPAERVRYFPNWVNTSKIRPFKHISHFREQLAITEDKIVVLFSGSLGGKQGLLNIPMAAELLKNRTDLMFVICGDGVMKPQLVEATADLPNFKFLPLQPIEQLSELLGMADIHLLPQDPNATDLVLPSKLVGMLASGKPVIATCNDGTEIAHVLSGCGIVVPPENPQALAEAITRLASNLAEREKLGFSARKFSEQNFSQDAVMRRLESQFLDIKAGKVNAPVKDIYKVYTDK